MQRGVRYLIVGGIGTLLYSSGVALLVEIFKLGPVVSAAISYLNVEIFFYISYRKWVYSPTQGHDTSLPRYIAVSALALFLNTGVMFVITDLMGYEYWWGLVAGIAIIPPTIFTLNWLWAFR